MLYGSHSFISLNANTNIVIGDYDILQNGVQSSLVKGQRDVLRDGVSAANVEGQYNTLQNGVTTSNVRARECFCVAFARTPLTCGSATGAWSKQQPPRLRPGDACDGESEHLAERRGASKRAGR